MRGSVCSTISESPHNTSNKGRNGQDISLKIDKSRVDLSEDSPGIFGNLKAHTGSEIQKNPIRMPRQGAHVRDGKIHTSGIDPQVGRKDPPEPPLFRKNLGNIQGDAGPYDKPRDAGRSRDWWGRTRGDRRKKRGTARRDRRRQGWTRRHLKIGEISEPSQVSSPFLSGCLSLSCSGNEQPVGNLSARPEGLVEKSGQSAPRKNVVGKGRCDRPSLVRPESPFINWRKARRGGRRNRNRRPFRTVRMDAGLAKEQAGG